jgi:hypothetical protein
MIDKGVENNYAAACCPLGAGSHSLTMTGQTWVESGENPCALSGPLIHPGLSRRSEAGSEPRTAGSGRQGFCFALPTGKAYRNPGVGLSLWHSEATACAVTSVVTSGRSELTPQRCATGASHPFSFQLTSNPPIS